jgi:cytochrome P450
MKTATVATSMVDLFSDDVLTEPYPTYAELREQAPVVWMERNGFYAITRYQQIREALANWKEFSSRQVAFNEQMNAALQGTTLATDPPDHQALRKALTENLSPRALRKMQASVEEKADRLVADLVERGTFDAIEDLARAFPLEVVSDLIGVQGEARENILRWGEAAFNVLGPMNQRTAESFPIAGELFQWCLTVRRDDLTEGSMGRAIFDAADRGLIPPESCGAIIHQYVAAGMDTTIASIGNALAQLGTHPEQYALLRDDPSLIPAAYNETLRYESPINLFGRYVTTDVDIEGTLIPGGSQVALIFAAGNRDPRHYEDPDRFLIERNPADHLAFGYGIHSCAGQGLAKLEAYALLGALTRRVRSFSVGEPTRQMSNTTRSLDRLPVVELEPA